VGRAATAQGHATIPIAVSTAHPAGRNLKKRRNDAARDPSSPREDSMNGSSRPNPFAPPRAPVDDLVDTVDAVDQMIQADRFSRLLATLIDILPFLGLFFIASFYVRPGTPHAATLAMGNGLAALIVALLLLTVILGVYSLMLLHRQGQTFGKAVMGIRVVRTDGSRVTLARVIFVRWLSMVVLGMIPFIGKWVSLVDSLAIARAPARCVHDNIADTMVVTAASSPHATLEGSRGTHLRTFTL
jgi:uncharacterized RDD family membrane protein YckC